MTQNNLNPLDKDNLNSNNSGDIDINTLSTILTDSELRPEELKKLDEEKKSKFSGGLIENDNNKVIFDVNINELDDLLYILLKNNYDFLVLEPSNDIVKISFKKDSILKESKFIQYPVYLKLILKAKSVSKLNLEETKKEQKGEGNYLFKDKNLDILVKTIPTNFGENIFLKVKLSENKAKKNVPVKKGVSAGTAFGFLGGILFIALILGGAFLSFVVLNAKTPEDVSFFGSLGISLNDINSFLLKLTTFIFSIIIVIETIILIITLFKALFTKKDQKRKKLVFTILSILMLIIAGSTASLWMYLDKTIKRLPNWLEYSYGLVQIYDNNLLNNEKIGKSGAIIEDLNALIGPIDLKFDVNYLQKDEARKGFQVNKFIWNFGNGKLVETKNPEVIQSFGQKGNYKISLTLEGIDTRFREKGVIQKPASEQPEISIAYLVDIKQKVLENGGKTISFDAKDLKPLGELEWYTQDDLTKPAYVGYNFQPSKIYFDSDLVGMKIKNSKSSYMSRIFTIDGESSQIKGNIKEEISYDNDLEYTFKVEDIENTFGDGFIEEFIWTIDGREIKKKADILRLEDSSSTKYVFPEYGKYEVKVVLKNSNGKSNQITKTISTAKKIKFTGKIDFYINSGKLENIKYDEKTLDYFVYDIGAPTKVEFDAKNVRPDNSLYLLDSIKWDVGSDGTNDGEGKIFEYEFNFPGFQEVSAKYKFKHRRNKEEFIEATQKINLEFVEKDAILSLNLQSDTEYAPALVKFDASLSKVKNDDIIKFIYDYGDGIIEERDALNPGHRYLKEGNYKVKLTIVTRKGKSYSIVKDLILKPFESSAKISVSMKKAPINQEIDFLSTKSTGQIITYHWDFGDGEISSQANPSHAYKSSGKYKVTLTLDLANNNIMKDEVDIEIE